MNLLPRVFKLRISSKLLLFNILISLVFVFVFLAVFLSFRHAQNLLAQTVENSLTQVTANARISRGLTIIVADVNVLLNTFYEKEEYLRASGQSLVNQAELLYRQTDDVELKTALDEVMENLRLLIQQGSSVNGALQWLRDTDTDIQKKIELLEQSITGKIVEWVFKEEDTTILEQLATLVTGFREGFMGVGKHHAELWPDHYFLSFQREGDPVIGELDDLILRMRTMTAADVEIAEMVQDIIVALEQYEDILAELHLEMLKLRASRQRFEQTQAEILGLMARIDQRVTHITRSVRGEIHQSFRNTGIVTLAIGLTLVLFLGFMTSVLFRTLLKQPMQAVHDGIRNFREGKLDTRVKLKREDEWAVIEQVFNSMAEELSSTYATLEDKISELEDNIQARRQAEKDVRKSEEKYRSIFENALEGLFQISEDGRILSANPAFARIFGFHSPVDIINSVSDITAQLYCNPKDRKDFLRQLRDQGTISGFEAQFRRKNGEIIWGSVNARLIERAGNPTYIEGIFQDITPRKRAEAEKQGLEAQLRQSQKMEAVGNLAGGIAHDFNNLLQAISGYLQLLLMEQEPSDKDYNYLVEMNRATERAIDIARRLLTFSRKIETKKTLVDLNEIIEGTVSMLNHTVPKMIAIETDLASDLFKIEADPTQLDQILMNLASNGADAMPTGGVLSIGTENIMLDKEFQTIHLEVDAGEYVLITVEDSGQGIDKENLEHIFEPFFTTKEVGKGTGLGLSSVYGIVKGMKGHISCYSEVGVGTIFKIYLPAVGKETDPGRVHEVLQKPIMQGSETILVVDDEAMIREVAEQILHTFGYEVIQAASGEEALAVYKDQGSEVDLVILDIGMPGMGGERCLAELRLIDPSVKVLVASGYASHGIARSPESHGAVGFVGKPYQLRELMAVVREVLDVSVAS